MWTSGSANLSIVAAMLVFAAVVGSAQAEPRTYWATATGNWSNGANWTAGEPDLGYYAMIGNGGTAQITMGGEVCAYLYVPDFEGTSGNVSMTSGDLTAADVLMGYYGTGTFTQSGGTVTLSDGLWAGRYSGNATYTLSGGDLSAAVESIALGLGGQATFYHSGGTNTVGGFPGLRVGDGGSGWYYLSGTGQVSANTVFVGNGGGTGIFEQSSGTCTITDRLHMGGNGGTGTYNLNGGTLSAVQEWIGRDTRNNVFTQTGGTNTVGGTIYIPQTSYGGGTYNLAGGTLSAAGIEIGCSGAGSFNIDDPAAEMTISETLTLGENSTFDAVSGAAIHMTGADFENLNTNEAALAGLANLELIFEGGSGDTDELEVGSEDKGAVEAGFVDNFALGKLTLGGADVGMVRLVDNTDNGNRDGTGGNAEALYVDRLELGAGSVLDLNNLHLYWCTEFVDNGGSILNGQVWQVETCLAVEIDIRPWSDANLVNPMSKGVVPVAILGSDDFDVANVDVSALAFGPGGAPPVWGLFLSHWDLNDDGWDDGVSYYRTEETGIAMENTDACLTGETLDGTRFQGCDAITTVSCGLGAELVFLLPPLIWLHQRRRHGRA